MTRAARLEAAWERRLRAEGLADHDRVIGPRGTLKARVFPWLRGGGGRVVEGRTEAERLRRLPMAGRGEGGDVRADLARVDLRAQRHRRRTHVTGRPRVEFPPGVRRRIAELHAEGYSYREICRVLELDVSYGTVRRVVKELQQLRRRRRTVVESMEALVRAADPALVRHIRGRTLEELESDPVVMDLLAQDRRTVWDMTLDGRQRPTRKRAIFPETWWT